MNCYPPEVKARVIDAIRTTGLSLRDVAEAFNISTSAVCNWARAAGVGRRLGPGGPPKCHPQRKHRGKGMCGSCYQRAWEAARKAS